MSARSARRAQKRLEARLKAFDSLPKGNKKYNGYRRPGSLNRKK